MREFTRPRPTTSTSWSPNGPAARSSSPPTGPQDWYPLFPNPVVAESLLDRFINNSHQVFMNGPSYRPHKRPSGRVSTTTKEATQ